MEPSQLASNKETWSFAISLANFFGGALAGIVTAIFYVSNIKSKVDKTSEKVDNLSKVVFKDTGGLNLLTVDAHTALCLANKELIAINLTHMKEALDRMEKNAPDYSRIVEIMESIEGELGRIRADDRKMRETQRD